MLIDYTPLGYYPSNEGPTNAKSVWRRTQYSVGEALGIHQWSLTHGARKAAQGTWGVDKDAPLVLFGKV
jgi:hypothetical protein